MEEFHQACKSGNLELVQYLHQQAPELIHQLDTNNWSCMYLACHYNNTSVIEWLLTIHPEFVEDMNKYISGIELDKIDIDQITHMDFIKALLKNYPKDEKVQVRHEYLMHRQKSKRPQM
jgi:hypothetical protein